MIFLFEGAFDDSVHIKNWKFISAIYIGWDFDVVVLDLCSIYDVGKN